MLQRLRVINSDGAMLRSVRYTNSEAGIVMLRMIHVTPFTVASAAPRVAVAQARRRHAKVTMPIRGASRRGRSRTRRVVACLSPRRTQRSLRHATVVAVHAVYAGHD
jgi:hypothetical protein